MSNIDKRALREAAEKALPAMMRLLMMPNDELFDEALLNVDGDVDAANAFNLLAGPETVLAMLDELEESKRLRLKFQEANCELCQKLEVAEKTSAARLGAIDTTHKMFQRERDRADAAEKRTSELSQKADIYDMLRQDYGLQGSLVEFVDWQAKRIAELEKSHAQVIQARDHYKRMCEEGFRRINQSINLSINGEG